MVIFRNFRVLVFQVISFEPSFWQKFRTSREVFIWITDYVMLEDHLNLKIGLKKFKLFFLSNFVPLFLEPIKTLIITFMFSCLLFELKHENIMTAIIITIIKCWKCFEPTPSGIWKPLMTQSLVVHLPFPMTTGRNLLGELNTLKRPPEFKNKYFASSCFFKSPLCLVYLIVSLTQAFK